jgi:DNA-binding MarR family transcriptional regulator
MSSRTHRQAEDLPRLAPPVIELEGVDELSLAAFRGFIHALRLHRRHMLTTLAEHGFHLGQAWCLRELSENDGITQRDLAEALHLARPTVTRMLQGMEKAGLVARSADENDQRLVRVTLTAAGRKLEGEMRRISADYVEQTIGTLSERDRRELARLLEELAASIAEAMGEHGEVPPRPGAKASVSSLRQGAMRDR